MVTKRKLDYGPSSFGFPVIPRGPRSVRRRVSGNGGTEDSQLSAFELLAAVAGKILQESESSAFSNIAAENDPSVSKLSQASESDFGKGKQEGVKAWTPECPDRGSCVESSCRPGLPAKRSDSKSPSRKLVQKESDTVLESGSIISASKMSKNDADEVKFKFPDNKVCVKHEGDSPNWGESSDGYVDNSIERQKEVKVGNFNQNADFTVTDTSKDKLKINVNYYPLINTDSSVQKTSFRDSVPNDSFLRRRNNVNGSIRDDDEKFVRFDRCKPKIRASSPQSYIGYRRIRKSTSKYWKVAPKLKDSELSNSERGIKHIFYNRKYCHTSERIRREVPFKKRKLFIRTPRHASDGEGSSESISNTPGKRLKGEKIGSAFKSCKVREISSPYAGQVPAYRSMDSHGTRNLKFSIKSFKVPELYIEVPESATVGSLKRTVMEAVTAILQEGLRVGVLLQGEKVKDDERTLLQSGISQNGNLENLGFSLEPTSVIAPPPVSTEAPLTLLPSEKAEVPLTLLPSETAEAPLTLLPSETAEAPLTLLPSEATQQLTRFVTGPLLDLGLTIASADPPQVDNKDIDVTSNHEVVPFSANIVIEEPDSRALVPLPEASTEALSMVPATQKARRTELAHRRTRRPFSVTEVEALVEAVVTLGTGRWRDVKLRAFENADHRTYVDLKDKWKTLVHTASISPQQRRGQPVPQELLDRVLGAHSYWSQHQSKQQHNKNQVELVTA